MQLKEVSARILDQIIQVTKQLEDQAFRQPLKVLSDNTIGKHVRHIIEFYDLMILGINSGEVNYDQRSHDRVIEENRLLAIEKMNSLKIEIEKISGDSTLTLKANYNADKDDPFRIVTSYYRELQYNIEHAIHHMAIIKIAIKSEFPSVEIPDGFGIAYSTIKYEKDKTCAR
ncbi:hypothetical protein [Roseivirga misakiensis]|uniref:DinB-like domain-containing protein n=1 Tax=Roseivirga misakiensis TaxID=1563681 RepID=A0A1E5T317_9BACT|nr:hypothetical protein [Roseivirga misakiensis]OEK05775.1 hypothetical protein BFP71_06545 [Roseivirga misakiensis]